MCIYIYIYMYMKIYGRVYYVFLSKAARGVLHGKVWAWAWTLPAAQLKIVVELAASRRQTSPTSPIIALNHHKVIQLEVKFAAGWRHISPTLTFIGFTKHKERNVKAKSAAEWRQI